jgi:poly-gamma-glutamate synthesis protein (capsule biosynthesis protein)
MRTRIIIGGDLYPGHESQTLLADGKVDRVFEGLLPVFTGAHFVLANLEGPLIREPTPIEKIGPHHGFDESCARGLAMAGIHALNLGNNHVMDHGEGGLRNTMRCLREHRLAHVGAGTCLAEAGQPLVCEVNGMRLGILAYTEFEFGIAGHAQAGTHPIDPIQFLRTLERHRKSWDQFIVLLHAGNEYYPYPRPQLREFARFLCEQGATAVVFQHSHCAGCWESHHGGFIIHGQGNLLFNTCGAHGCEMTGFLVQLEFDGSAPPQMELVPFFQMPSGIGPRILTGNDKETFLKELARRNQAIQHPGFVERQWKEFATSSPYNYLALIQGYPRKFRELDLKCRFLHRFYSKKRLRMLLHLLRCESHREATIEALTSAIDR